MHYKYIVKRFDPGNLMNIFYTLFIRMYLKRVILQETTRSKKQSQFFKAVYKR